MKSTEEKKIETIFNHWVTEEELKHLFGKTIKDENDYIRFVGYSEASFITDIVRLYLLRGDRKTASEYAKRLDRKTAFGLLVHD